MKIALVVVDGLALDQWVVLRKALGEKRPGLRFRENSVFGWVPTITAVSRQALFSGKMPLYFPGSLHTTSKEQALWRQLWQDQGFKLAQIAYAKGLGDKDLNQVRELLEQPQVRIVGLVVDKVDKIMHGMELGTAGMHNQVRQWALQGYMSKLIDILHNLGFKVWLTSDHGNVEAEGWGRPMEGAIADLRGERVRVFSDSLLRSKVRENYPEAVKWPCIGLPEDFLCLLASQRFAFVPEGKDIVAHGGICIEELVVPFVEIEPPSSK